MSTFLQRVAASIQSGPVSCTISTNPEFEQKMMPHDVKSVKHRVITANFSKVTDVPPHRHPSHHHLQSFTSSGRRGEASFYGGAAEEKKGIVNRALRERTVESAERAYSGGRRIPDGETRTGSNALGEWLEPPAGVRKNTFLYWVLKETDAQFALLVDDEEVEEFLSRYQNEIRQRLLSDEYCVLRSSISGNDTRGGQQDVADEGYHSSLSASDEKAARANELRIGALSRSVAAGASAKAKRERRPPGTLTVNAHTSGVAQRRTPVQEAALEAVFRALHSEDYDGTDHPAVRSFVASDLGLDLIILDDLSGSVFRHVPSPSRGIRLRMELRQRRDRRFLRRRSSHVVCQGSSGRET